MVVSSPPQGEPFGSALRTVRDALGRVAQQPTWSVSDDALPMLLGETRAVIAGLQELGCRLLAEADGRNLADQYGASSTAAWVDRCWAAAEARRVS